MTRDIDTTAGGRPLTGRKVLIITVSAFLVIIGANMTLLWAALGSFPGLEVKNSYVASQAFDSDRAAQEALGWDLALAREDGRLVMELGDMAGNPVYPSALEVKIGRSTHTRDDRVLTMVSERGRFVSEEAVEPGNWTVWVSATAPDGTAYRQRLSFYVRQDG